MCCPSQTLSQRIQLITFARNGRTQIRALVTVIYLDHITYRNCSDWCIFYSVQPVITTFLKYQFILHSLHNQLQQYFENSEINIAYILITRTEKLIKILFETLYKPLHDNKTHTNGMFQKTRTQLSELEYKSSTWDN